MATRTQASAGRTSRNRRATDADFSVTYIARETLISTGGAVSSTVQDRNITTHSPAVVDHEANLQVTETVPGTFTPYLRFVSLDEDIAAVDSVGNVTRVSDGTARILAKTRLLNNRIDVPVSRETGQTVVALDSYVAGSLARECSEAVDSRLSGKAKPIYSTANHATATYVRNTDCWAYGIDLTCVSPWNSAGGISYAGTAISRRHIIFARHWPIPNGATVRFIDNENSVVERTMTSSLALAGSGYQYDLTIGLLDSDLPGSIKPAEVLPANVLDYLPSLSNLYPLPCLALDREEKAIITDLRSLSSIYVECKVPMNEDRLAFFESLISGDSGNPCFLLIDGEPVLVTTWTFGGSGAGPRIHALRSEINAAMATLGGGYELSVKDLSDYIRFPLEFSAADNADGRLLCEWPEFPGIAAEDAQTIEYSDDGVTGWITLATPDYTATDALITINNPALSRYYRLRVLRDSDAVVFHSAAVGPVTVTGDTDGAAYDSRLAVSLGADSSRRQVLMDLVASGKANGWYTKLKDFWMLGWGNATANRSTAKSSSAAQLTYVGTVTHAANKVELGADGAINTGYANSSIGWSAQSVAGHGIGLFACRANAILDASVYCEIGVTHTGRAVIQTGVLGFNRSVLVDGSGLLSWTYIATPGIICAKRVSLSCRVTHTTTSGVTALAAANRAEVGYAMAGSRTVHQGCDNNGTLLDFSSGHYWGGGLINADLTDTEMDDMGLDLTAAAIDLGWVTP